MPPPLAPPPSPPTTVAAARRVGEVGIAVAVVVLVGIADFATGVELDLSLVYLFPIAAATWRVSRGAGAAIAILSAVMDEIVDLHVGRYHPAALPVTWNATVQSLFFFAVVVGLDRAKAGYRRERTLAHRLEEAYTRLEREIGVVAEIQRSLLPDATPVVAGLRVAAHYAPSARAGGDYYDFLPLAQGRIGVLVADASGHGPPAAVIMAMVRALVHADASVQEPPERLLEATNGRLLGAILPEHFMTACYVVYDPASRRLEWSLAGHPLPLLRPADGGATVELGEPSAPPLGIVKGARFVRGSRVLRPGDVVVLYTDGLTEAHGPRGDLLDVEGVTRALDARPGADAEATLAEVVAAMRRHTGDAPPADDVTVVVLEVLPAATG